MQLARPEVRDRHERQADNREHRCNKTVEDDRSGAELGAPHRRPDRATAVCDEARQVTNRELVEDEQRDAEDDQRGAERSSNVVLRRYLLRGAKHVRRQNSDVVVRAENERRRELAEPEQQRHAAAVHE